MEKENAAAIRDAAIVELSALPSYPSNEEVVEFNRRLFPKSQICLIYQRFNTEK
jgi:hypothetical protein